MKIKRYKGGSLEKIREFVIKDLGESAVIVNIQKIHGKGILSMGSHESFEVVAALDDTTDAESARLPPPSAPPAALQEFMEQQKDLYKNLRKSIKMLDDKLVEIDGRIESAALGASCASVDALANVHEAWRGPIRQKAMAIAAGAEPTPFHWHEALSSMIPTAGGILFRKTPGSPPDIYLFLGATGVGKTTTLAKLAAKCVLNERLEVGVVSIDTFRVAAVEQLREYSSLLGVEMAVAFTAEELRGALDRFDSKDVVFIDSPGRGPYDIEGIASIAKCLAGVKGICVILVAPAGIRAEEAASVASAFSALSPSAVILTKTDEASRCDGLTTLIESARTPVVYLSDGQRVPEDIHPASPGLVASLVMPSATAPLLNMKGLSHVEPQ